VRIQLTILVVVWSQSAVAATVETQAGDHRSSRPPQFAQAARTCKQVSSCREAVELWCGGYSRADGDHDGIPCENVCRSKDAVDKIRDEIGC